MTMEWTPEQIEEIYNYVYIELIESIDAIDNGISQYDLTDPPKYRLSTHLSNRVARLNLNWNENNSNDLKTLEMKRFEKAMKICGKELIYFVQYCAFSYIPARKLVQDAMSNRKNLHESGQIIEIPSFCPWADHLYQIEKEIEKTNIVCYHFNKQQGVLCACCACGCGIILFEKAIKTGVVWCVR